MSDPESEPEIESSGRELSAWRILRSSLGRYFLILALVLTGALASSPLWGQISSVSSAEGAGGAPEFDRAPAPLVIFFVFLLCASGTVSGSETAIFSLNKVDLVRARRKPTASSRALIGLLDHPNGTLTTLLVLNNLLNVALSLTAGALTESLFSGLTVAGFAAAAFGATALLLTFGEVVPKCIAHVHASTVAHLVALPTAAAATILTPARLPMNAIIRWVFARFGIRSARVTDRLSEDELKAMIQTGEAATVLEEDEREMIHSVFELSQTFAEEIMVPRPEVVGFDQSLRQDEMLAALRGERRSRVLIYHDSLDNLVGFVLAKEVLLNPERDWRESMREAMCVPERIKLLDLLARFRRHSVNIAVLVDEYGGVAGLVTIRDLLEEIVGDLSERHEAVTMDLEQLGANRWVARGRMNLDELGEELDGRFPEDIGTTVGGFIMNMLGHVPKTGDELRYDGLVMKVTRMTGRRISRVEIFRAAQVGSGTESDTSEEAGSR